MQININQIKMKNIDLNLIQDDQLKFRYEVMSYEFAELEDKRNQYFMDSNLKIIKLKEFLKFLTDKQYLNFGINRQPEKKIKDFKAAQLIKKQLTNQFISIYLPFILDEKIGNKFVALNPVLYKLRQNHFPQNLYLKCFDDLEILQQFEPEPKRDTLEYYIKKAQNLVIVQPKRSQILSQARRKWNDYFQYISTEQGIECIKKNKLISIQKKQEMKKQIESNKSSKDEFKKYKILKELAESQMGEYSPYNQQGKFTYDLLNILPTYSETMTAQQHQKQLYTVDDLNIEYESTSQSNCQSQNQIKLKIQSQTSQNINKFEFNLLNKYEEQLQIFQNKIKQNSIINLILSYI